MVSVAAASSGAAPGIAISGASIRFGGHEIATALDLTIVAGRTTCLLGPSGVGKTTLLKLIAGLVPPGATGEIRASDGFPLTGRVAYMAQQDLLLPWLNVLDNICLGFRLRRDPAGLAAARRRALDLLAEVGLEAWATASPSQLSGGMRQRAALLRTLVEDRPVVLMDEPFAQLDAVSRLELQELAARLLERRTVVLVTHDAFEALRIGHAVHVLAGRPVRIGAAITPAGLPPRAVDDQQALALQAPLLRELAAAHASLRHAA